MRLTPWAISTLQHVAYRRTLSTKLLDDARSRDGIRNVAAETVRRLFAGGYIARRPQRFNSLTRNGLQTADVLDITEAGRATLDALRKANPLASPFVHYRSVE